MLFTRNTYDPIYNSLSDFKSNTAINEWFNRTVYDEAALSHTARELESLLSKSPQSYFTQPPFDFKYFMQKHVVCRLWLFEKLSAGSPTTPFHTLLARDSPSASGSTTVT